MHELTNTEIVRWWRRIGVVTPGLAVCGDLPTDFEDAVDVLVAWIDAGVTDIVDVREEWSDEDLVADLAPPLAYHHVGTHDHGGTQADAWFDAGVAPVLEAMADDERLAVVHCHMGINRGPSLAFAALLAAGWDTVEALDAIRGARPIAAIAYAEDAVRWHGQTTGRSPQATAAEVRRVRRWHDQHDIDVRRDIRLIRHAEDRQAA